MGQKEFGETDDKEEEDDGEEDQIVQHDHTVEEDAFGPEDDSEDSDDSEDYDDEENDDEGWEPNGDLDKDLEETIKIISSLNTSIRLLINSLKGLK